MSEKIKKHFQLWKATYLLTMFVLVMGGVAYFINYANAVGGPPPGPVLVMPKTFGVDNQINAVGTEWRFTGTTTAELVSGDLVRFILPTSSFSISSPTATAVSGFTFFKDAAFTEPGVSSTSMTGSNIPLFYGFVSDTVASGTSFSVTLDGVNNPNFSSTSLSWSVLGGTPSTTDPIFNPLSVAKFILMGMSGIITTSPAPSSTPAITNVTLSDFDTSTYTANVGYGLDGRDFTVTWTPSSTVPAGYQMTNIFITTSGLQLVTSTLFSTGCNGAPCSPWGGMNQFSMATWTLPQFMKEDSTRTSLATSSSYVAWIYVQANTSFLVSSTPVSYADAFDVVADTSAPQINHMNAHVAKASTDAKLYANVFDDQTMSDQFANPNDGGEEYFRLYYTKNSDAWDSANSSTAQIVSGAGELYSFTIPSASVPANGGTVKYYLVARDHAGNTRYFCASSNANAVELDCQSSPFIANTVTISGDGRSVSGRVTSEGGNLSDAIVFVGGFAGSAVTTTNDGNGSYTISGVPDNDVFQITATKMGYAMAQRQENIGTVDKTGIDLNVNRGSMGFYQGEGGPGGDSGGAPRVMFSGPPDGMQGFPPSESLRVGFSQPLDSTTVTINGSVTSSNIYLIKSATGENVPGNVTYCANRQQTGCSALFDQDNNTVLFDPISNLATSTQYTLVITGAVKGQSGQATNRYQTSFTTVGNQFTNFSEMAGNYGMSGQYMPPYVRSMSPAPGMTVAPNAKVLVEFNQAMSSASISADTISLVKVGGATQSITVSLDNNEQRFVTLSNGALSTGEYEVRVLGAVSNQSGVPMRNPTSSIAFSSRFMVAGTNDVTSPTVYPALANGSAGVATNKVFEFGFNEQLSFSTVNTTNITMYRGSTAESINVQYDPGKNSIFVSPVSALLPNTSYIITLGHAVTDLVDNGITTSTYTYTTGNMDTARPQLREANCDDYRCQMVFSEPMNRDTQADSKWANSVINSSNWVVERTAPSSATIDLSGKPMTYDPIKFAVTVEGVAGLASGDTYRVTANANLMDLSDNTITTSSNQNIFAGIAKSSKDTYGSFGSGDMGMFGPPTENMMGAGNIGGGQFVPQGFGNFTADQFAMGQADMAYPFNPMASGDSNVFQVQFTPGVVLQTGDQIVLTFPNGTNVSDVAMDTQSPYYTDFNQSLAGVITGAVSDDNDTKVTITLNVSGTPNASDPVTIDLRKIINPVIPKGPSTGGYTVGIQGIRSGVVVVSKTSMPYFIMAGGSRSITVNVFASSASTPDNVAGTVYLHGGGPSGSMDKTLTMSAGHISAVDGSATTTLVYSNLNDGCYFIGTEPFVTLGDSDYYGQMSPEQICVDSGHQTATKNIVLTSASSNVIPVTVKFVGNDGVTPYVFGGKDIDIFAGGPGKFAVRTLSNVTTSLSAGYQIKLNANGLWNIGMGPAASKSASGGRPTDLGVMPPPPVQVNVSGLPASGLVSQGMPVLPPNVTYSNGTITFKFVNLSGAGKTVAGTVKDASGNGLANVDVFLHSQGVGSPVFTQTNASGTFSLVVPAFGNYEIGAHKDGIPEVVKNVEVRDQGGTKLYVDGKDVTGSFILGMQKADYTISGRFLDGSSNGIGYAPVVATDAGGRTIFSQTSADGSYTFFVGAGTWNVRAGLPTSKSDTCGTFSKVVVITNASQASQNITPSVSTCYSLSGTISAGSALANVPIFIEEWNNTTNQPVPGGVKKNASTDASGNYLVKLGSGSYRVGSWHPDYGELSATTTISGDATKNISITTSSVTFNFTGGTANMSGFVELKNAADQMKRIGSQIGGLDSPVEISTEAATYNYFVDVFGVGKFSGTVVAGNTATINLGMGGNDLVTVTGTIYDGSGTAKAGALVTFSNASTTETAVTDENGQYEAVLKAGTYTVADSLAGYTPTKDTGVVFTTNTSGYDFGTSGGGTDPNGQTSLLVAPYVIEGVVSSSAGAAMTDGYVWATNASGVVVTAPIDPTDGSYSLPVATGTWTINAVGPLHEATAKSGTVTVDGNETGANFALTANTDNISTSTTGIVTASAGGSVNDSAASGIKITAGAGVLDTGSGDVTLNLEKTFTAPDTENYGALGNATFSVSASGDSAIKNLNGNAELMLDYSSLLASLPAGVSESQLQLAYYSPERDEYVPVEGGFTVDTVNKTITGQVNHFTDFVITYRNSDAGITVTESDGSTAVTEGGATDSVTYVLTSAPTANVVITPSASGSKVTLSPASMTFTSVNWATPQTLTVTAVDDATVEGTHSDTITHLVSSSDTNYSGVSISNITATITDNDSAGGGSTGGGNSADTTPPANTSVVIAGGATSTASTAVTLTFGATDASQMMIGNSSAFTSSTWEVYTVTKLWTLTSGVGTKAVYAKFRDTTGNVSSPVSDTIELVAGSTATTTLPIVVVTPIVATPTVETPVTTLVVTVANPDSKVIVTPPTIASYQPGAVLKFSYSYKNETSKSLLVKITRQLINSKNKIVKTASVNKTLKTKGVYVGKINEAVPSNLAAGEYTTKIKIFNAKTNKLLAENSFKIQVEKLKKKYFILAGELPVGTDIVFDSSAWKKVKSNVLLPVSLKLKYSYTNNTNKKHTVKMVRELIGQNGKVLAMASGRWTMKVGEKDSASFTQSLSKDLLPGTYQVRLRAYDLTTKELLTENSFGFVVELR